MIYMNNQYNSIEHWNNKHLTSYGDLSTPYEKINFLDNWETYTCGDHGISLGLFKENKNDINRKTVLEVGCADGKWLWYLKNKIAPEFECTGIDFSEVCINANQKRCSDIKWEQRDILKNPIEEDYGVICCFQTIEHFIEGDNYKILDNMLKHSEMVFLGTVDTVDDCFGEHVSHYTIDTFDNKGYDVIWKAKLGEINMPDGIYHYIFFVIKGELY